MEKFHLQLYLTSICLFLILVSGFASLVDKYTLGIRPEDASYYKSNVIKCKDGSKKFSREQLNDDFCDCVDGTDEPGTSACPEGKFYCHNVGHLPQSIFSSRVNDGICDCCDGSDEYDGTIKCKNSCWEAGKEAREKLNKKIKIYQEGVIIRRNEVEKGKHEFAKDKEELSKLKNEEKMLQDLVDKLKEQKERIEKAEEEERLKKEEEERLKKEEEECLKKEDEHLNKEEEEQKLKESEDILDEGDEIAGEADSVQASDSVQQNRMENLDNTHGSESFNHVQSGHESPSDTNIQEIVDDHRNLEAISSETTSDDNEEKEQGDSDDTSGLSKEELGRVVASRWTGEHKKTEEDEVLHDTTSDVDEDDNGYTSETEDDRRKYDDDFEDEADEEDAAEAEGSYITDVDDKQDSSGSTSWMNKIKETVNNVLSSFNFFRTPVDLSEADRIKKEYSDANSKLSKLQSRISFLSKKVVQDFGKDMEFYSFYDKCFESQQNKYKYKICPYKEATQGYTRLGDWEKFEESYRVMMFSNGEKCWNGPNRSLKVRLRCGLKNELADVDEPSICEYVGLMSTPAVCTEDKLKELQHKLEQMNSRQTEGRDEL